MRIRIPVGLGEMAFLVINWRRMDCRGRATTAGPIAVNSGVPRVVKTYGGVEAWVRGCGMATFLLLEG